jgi:hypothetical protein
MSLDSADGVKIKKGKKHSKRRFMIPHDFIDDRGVKVEGNDKKSSSGDSSS